jgi:hypothetical protein
MVSGGMFDDSTKERGNLSLRSQRTKVRYCHFACVRPCCHPAMIPIAPTCMARALAIAPLLGALSLTPACPILDTVNSSVSAVFVHVLTEHAEEGRNRRHHWTPLGTVATMSNDVL